MLDTSVFYHEKVGYEYSTHRLRIGYDLIEVYFVIKKSVTNTARIGYELVTT